MSVKFVKLKLNKAIKSILSVSNQYNAAFVNKPIIGVNIVNSNKVASQPLITLNFL